MSGIQVANALARDLIVRLPVLTWAEMDALPRRPVASLRRAHLPGSPGVYAWYRDGAAVYVGRATGRNGLQQCIWKNHMRTTAGSLHRSSFRRVVAERVGVGTADDIQHKRVVPTDAQAAEVSAWIRACDLAWVETATEQDAVFAYRALRQERTPILMG